MPCFLDYGKVQVFALNPAMQKCKKNAILCDAKNRKVDRGGRLVFVITPV